MRVLVTGATGFVASHLVPELVAEGHEVIALGHDAERLATREGVQPLVLDLRERGFTGRLEPVDAVVHLAQANVPFPDGAADLFAVNTASTVELLEHARRTGAGHFVFASSASVYGAGDRAWREDDAAAASDFYAATKRAGEGFVTAYASSFATTIMRLVAPYGPGQRNRMIPRLVESVRGGRPVRLNAGGRPTMNPVYVSDVCAAVAACLAGRPHPLLNVAGDEAVTIRELAEAIGRVVGREPLFDETDAAVPGDIVCDNARLHDLLGDRRLVSLEEGLRRTAEAAAAAT